MLKPNHDNTMLLTTIREATLKDTQQILGLLYELERPEPIDKNEVKIFKNKIQDYWRDGRTRRRFWYGF